MPKPFHRAVVQVDVRDSKVRRTLHALLSSSPENYLVYDSMLLRLLHSEDPEHFNGLLAAAPDALRDLLKVERDALNAADDIIGLSGKKNPPTNKPKGKGEKNPVSEPK